MTIEEKLTFITSTGYVTNVMPKFNIPTLRILTNEEIDDTMTQSYSILRSGRNTVLLSHSISIVPAMQAGRALGCAVIKMNQLWPIDAALTHKLSQYSHVVYISEEERSGSIGESIAAALSGMNSKVHILAPHGFVEQGNPTQLQRMLSLDAEGIIEYCRKECNHGSETTS